MLRYFLRADFQRPENEEYTTKRTAQDYLDAGYTEVTREQWIKAERRAGFWPRAMASNHPKYWDTLATGGFGGNGMSGSYIEEKDEGNE